MEEAPGYRMLPVAITAGGAVLIAVALFGVSGSSERGSAPDWIDTLGGTAPMAFKTYACPQCRQGITWGDDSCPRCGYRVTSTDPRAVPSAAPNGAIPGRETEIEANAARNATIAGRAAQAGPPLAQQVGAAAGQEAEVEANAIRNRALAPGLTPGDAAPAANAAQFAASPLATVTPAAIAPGAPPALVSPRDQNAAGKEFIEGHWLGLEVIPLTAELAKEYQIPKGEAGVLVDEITLEAAESGILAGDMVQSVDGRPTPDLRAFFLATQRVQDQERADVTVSRRGERMTFFMEARNTKTLGFSQMEAAQPIQPGALSPHRARSKACTECHVIMRTGGQLPTDAGDITTNPPPIARNATVPHQYRGQCARCHVVK